MEKLIRNRAQLFVRNKDTVFTMGGTLALRSVDNKFSGEILFCSYFPNAQYHLKASSVSYIAKLFLLSEFALRKKIRSPSEEKLFFNTPIHMKMVFEKTFHFRIFTFANVFPYMTLTTKLTFNFA